MTDPDDLITRYPSAPGHRDTDTSRAAAVSMREKAPRLHRACLGALEGSDRTADEIAGILGESILAIRPRLTELQRLGKVSDTGTRRANSSGRTAIVWRLA